MSLSQATVTPSNIPLTPMRVNWNGVDLGGTTDHCAIAIKYDTADIMADQFGKSILDKVVSGLSFTIKMTLAEAKFMDNWKVAFQSAHLINNSGTKSIYADMQIGDRLLAKAQPLILHPLDSADSDLNHDFKFFKAICIEASEVKYGPDKQSGLNVEFMVFPDTGVSPARYMIYGDPSNGIVHATAAAAVSGGGNVGNGTIGSITVADGYTKTETITVTCLGQTSGNNFGVSGSVSGALGTVHVGASNANTGTFNSNPINFIITQGTVQFANGDSFTIATTASNFS